MSILMPQIACSALIILLLLSWFTLYRCIKNLTGILKTDTLKRALTYSTAHLNDKDYISWLQTQQGASSDISNKHDRYDENYQRYLDRQQERHPYGVFYINP